MSTLSDAGLKNRLEHGVWLDEIERSFAAWRQAPHAEKPGLLLSGMMLTWAENRRLTHAEDFAPPIHTYIARSLAAQSGKVSAEREAKDLETRRRDRVYQQILLLMAVFVIVVLGPSAMRVYVAQLDRLAGVEPRRPDDKGQRRTAVAIQEEPPAGFGTQSPTPPPAALTWPPQRLLQQARTDALAGRRREAVLYALEALDAGKRTPADAAPTDQTKALSLIAETAREKAAMPQLDDASADAPVHVCSPTRFVVQSSAGAPIVVDTRNGNVVRPALPALHAGGIDGSCNAMLSIGEDYDIRLHTVGQGVVRAKTLGTHDAAVVAARFSGDGQRIVTVARDAVGKIWDRASGKQIASFRSDAQMFSGAALSHDGAVVLTWSDAKAAELWDGRTGKRVGMLAGHQSQIMTARFSADGKTILTVSVDGTAIAWDSATRTERAALRPAASSIVDAWLTPDGQRAAAVLEEGRVHIWSIGTDTPSASIDLGEDKLQSVVMSPDGRLLGMIEKSGAIGVYSLANGERLLDLNRGGDVLAGATFDGDRLIAFTRENVLRWPMLQSRDAALAVSHAPSQCWSPVERVTLKLEPLMPAWCQNADTAPGAEQLP